ncbi:MAG: OmpA family protein [candidate division Zixibacteria bacterium]|nr:OmpA family protein [candidate division Zixibacteria bacterium]
MRITTVIFILALLVSGATATEYRFALGAGGGMTELGGGDFFSFDSKNPVCFTLGHRLSSGWQLNFSYQVYTMANDTGVDLIDSVGDLYNNSPLEYKTTRLGLLFDHKLFNAQRFLNLTFGLGGGLSIWKVIDPATHTTMTVRSDKNETTDFSASELFLSGSAGILVRPSDRISLHLSTSADYLTGAGAEFETAINERRDKLSWGGSAILYFHFGRADVRRTWQSDDAWSQPADTAVDRSLSARRDSDGDGVEDRLDSCLNTPKGADVDRQGCPRDGDRDGVPNGLDDCPGTLVEARHLVDIHGCPVDSDFDGVPDFADTCAFNPVGAIVDENGCPIDTDNDGVPDGLDDCPYTLVAVEVDRHGCIDLSMLSKPMVLNIDYASGSFEVDPHNRKRIERLASLLNFVTDIRLDINGYTDNIGQPSANRALSEKRANRVKGILVNSGIAPERIKTYGRGETDFVASNQTAKGRALNRRIQIVFYK